MVAKGRVEAAGRLPRSRLLVLDARKKRSKRMEVKLTKDRQDLTQQLSVTQLPCE